MKQNEEVILPPKAFDTLLELVKLKGRVLEREALMRKVWPDTFVEEGNVKVTIFNLRKAIEDNPSEPRFIQTVARRGYRFGVDVIESQEIADQAGVDLNIKSIAVLPFKLLGGVEEEYLGVGLADALIIKLSGLSNIIVRPTSAVRRYIGSDERADEIARQLNVEAILEGNIYSAGNRVRVTAQLINVKGVTPLWAGKFDARFTDIFDVEDSISEQVAQALMLKLTGRDRQRLTTHYTENIKAYQFYLKGRYHWAKRLSAGTRLAAEHFRAAIDLDPNYSLAYAGLADCYTQLAWLRFLAPCEALPLAKAAALRALELDPLLGEAYASLAWIRLLYDLDYEAAENGFRHSLEYKALTLDPLSPIINAVAGWPFYFMRDYQRAIECYRRAIELEPKSLPAHYLLALSYLQFGEPEHAVAEMQIARALDDSSMTVAGLAEAYSGVGEITKATELLEELNRMAGEGGKYVSPYDVAAVYLRLGSADRAMGLLENAFEDQSTWRMLLPVDPKFDQLRHDVRFDVLLKRMGTKN